ncbi:spore coat protein GerQ [Salipaludibacillus daqingensis]|uniref:spore coat protein GerQ n=1 Tax=Salipaludibacillus daqingensis TaxID=3041001 RepID=UPI0024733FEE|nr:spore coat protein GerQ [Salipaludibacillus daqingensis]
MPMYQQQPMMHHQMQPQPQHMQPMHHQMHQPMQHQQHMQHMQQPMQHQPFLPGTPMPPPPQFTMQQPPRPQMPDIEGMLPIEMSYIENILRLNRQRVGTFYMTYENNEKWNAKIFKGVIEAAGRDHIIISDPQTDKRYLLLMVNLDYVTFDGEIEYDYPFNDIDPGEALATYPPR